MDRRDKNVNNKLKLTIGARYFLEKLSPDRKKKPHIIIKPMHFQLRYGLFIIHRVYENIKNNL